MDPTWGQVTDCLLSTVKVDGPRLSLQQHEPSCMSGKMAIAHPQKSLVRGQESMMGDAKPRFLSALTHSFTFCCSHCLLAKA